MTTNAINNTSYGLKVAGSITTAPPSSSTATTAFGSSLTLNTPSQNTTGYDLLLNICCVVLSATSATLELGVGPTGSPTANTVIPTFTVATTTLFTFSAIVPNNYYVFLTDTGSLSLAANPTVQVCPL